jgi:hypothetical protein
MSESRFQRRLLDRIENMFPECICLKTDPNYIQGIPDWIVLNGDRWIAIEAKRSSKASKRPNQVHWVTIMNQMSYARFVYPENEEEVLNEIRRALRPSR